MCRVSVAELRTYLLRGRLSPRTCLSARPLLVPRPAGEKGAESRLCRVFHSATVAAASSTGDYLERPLRKQWKDEIRREKKTKKDKLSQEHSSHVDDWELTVGVEVHAQLNSARKLFSPAATCFNEEPNNQVALFDVAMPGSQPLLQKEVLVPAIRAALSLNCDIQPRSRFDRKHYFWWDQPSGYQITQYYEPFATNGHIILYARDGIAAEDGESVTIGIKQLQLEQDTAKTVAQAGGLQWLDFNRVGLPLLEIITAPDLHHPRTAAALVRKIQLLLNAVDACVSGMERGGLRADINVSVRRRDQPGTELGTRTEIKNLGTIKAIEDAIVAERDRQIRELEAGGVIAGETRGWTLGSRETRRLRGKEGEVDYRYMPDADLSPLVIGNDLVDYLRSSLPALPDAELDRLVADYGLTTKDALSLMTIDDGARAEYFYRVVDQIGDRMREQSSSPDGKTDLKSYATLAANWLLHELGRLTTYKAGPLSTGTLTFSPDGECAEVDSSDLADLLYYLHGKKITGKVAKELLLAIYLDELKGGVKETIESNGLWFKEISEKEYGDLADEALKGEGKLLKDLVDCRHFPQGKFMYLVGKMMRLGPTERIDAATAAQVMRERVEQARTFHPVEELAEGSKSGCQPQY